MSALHDLYCPRCGTERYDVHVTRPYPECPNCQTTMRVSWEHGQAPSTDVQGSEQVSEVLSEPGAPAGTPLRYSSQREKDAKMKEQGFEPCGDKVNGSRNEDHRNLGKKFSFGSARRVSSPNRARA